MTKREIWERAARQLAIDYNCEPGDFFRDGCTVGGNGLREGSRKLWEKPCFFQMATFGKGIVVSCDEQVRSWSEKYFDDKKGLDCFYYPVMRDIDNTVRPYGQQYYDLHLMYLPDPDFPRETDASGLDLKWYEWEEIHPFYEDKRFVHALTYKPDLRRDTLAVVAWDGAEIMGMAACSEDSFDMWQIGIDVMPAYRRRGLGELLVKALTAEIFRKGKLPYYGTWPANIGSRTIARNCGFLPAWTQGCTEEVKKELE